MEHTLLQFHLLLGEINLHRTSGSLHVPALQILWRSSVLATTYSITDTDIIFGILSSKKYVLNLNFILDLAKKYIRDYKMTSQNISFLSFLVLLRQELSFEEQICIKNQREQDFIEKWFWLYDQL